MSVTALTTTGRPTSALTGSISGTVLNVTAITGTLAVGTFIYDATGATSYGYIVSFGSGSGGTGTYNLSASSSVASSSLTTLRGWLVPSDWDPTQNTVEVIGGGGGAGVNFDGGVGGGGGGAYSLQTNFPFTVGSYVPYFVGPGGTAGTNAGGGGTDGADSWFNGASLAASGVGGKGGKGGYSGGSSGGAAASGVGSTKHSGGNGAINLSAAASGGGAAGPRGNGGNGAVTPSSIGGGSGGGGAGGGGSGTNGANGSAGTPGAGGGNGGNNAAGVGSGAGGPPISNSGSPGTLGGGGGGGSTTSSIETNGGAGGAGADWTVTGGGNVGAGGGGGSAGSRGSGGNGGLYGGGGGSGNDAVIPLTRSGGTGGQGIIVITNGPTGVVHLRTPLIDVQPVTGGLPNLRAPLLEVQPVSGGLPFLRAPLITVQPMTGGLPHLRCALIVVQAVIPVPEELPVATAVYPTLVGLSFNVKKSPQFSTVNPVAASGRDVATALMPFPIWHFELNYDYLPDGAPWGSGSAGADVRTLAGFFKNQKGKFGRWLFPDPDDFHVVGGAIATADGVTTQFAFAAPVMGGNIEPVGQVDLSTLATFLASAVNTGANTITIPNHGFTTGQYPPMFISNPGTLPTPLAASTPYWPIVVDKNTIKLATTEANAIGGTAITLSAAGSGANTLAKGYAIYDNGSIVNPGSASLTLPNQMVFGSAPTSGHAITADFDYYFVCRFEDDVADFEKFMFRLWQLGKLGFRSIIQ